MTATRTQLAFYLHHAEKLRGEDRAWLEDTLGVTWKLSEVREMLSERDAVLGAAAGKKEKKAVPAEVRIPLALFLNPAGIEALETYWAGSLSGKKKKIGPDAAMISQTAAERWFGKKNEIVVPINEVDPELISNLFDLDKDDFLSRMGQGQKKR